MLFDLLLKGGQVLSGGDIAACDVGVKDGLITALGRYLASDRVCPTYDVRGKWVLPGMADVFSQATADADGQAARARLLEVSERAAAGGVTMLSESVTPKPWETLPAAVERRASELDASWVDRCFSVRVMSGQLPSEEHLRESQRHGLGMLTVTLSPRLDGFGLDDGELFVLLERARKVGVSVGLIPEHPLFGRAVERPAIGVLRRMPRELTDRFTEEGEFCAVARALAVAEVSRSPLHILGVSTPSALGSVSRAQKRGVAVQAHVFAHSLLLHSALYRRRRGWWYRPLPPLRDKAQVTALWRRWRQVAGVVVGGGMWPAGALAQLEKDERPKNAALPVLPWAGPALLARAAQLQGFSLQHTYPRLSQRPYALLGFGGERGVLSVGAVADLVVIDPEQRERLGPRKPREGQEWNPLLGLTSLALPELVLSRGVVVAERGQRVAKEPRGQLAIPLSLRARS